MPFEVLLGLLTLPMSMELVLHTALPANTYGPLLPVLMSRVVLLVLVYLHIAPVSLGTWRLQTIYLHLWARTTSVRQA